MGRHEGVQKQLQVFYLGSSAALGALRRSMEAHGMVTRTRLTPVLDAVVVDALVPSDHPTLQAAYSLGIPVLRPDEAIEQFGGGMLRLDQLRAEPQSTRPAWSFRPGAR